MNISLAKAYKFSPPAFIGMRQYSFKNTSDDLYCVQFVQKKNNHAEYIVDLSIDDSDFDEYLTTNFGDIFRVMATVVHILIDFIEKTNYLKSIEFVPIEEKNKKVNRRLIVFERYAKIFCATTGWHYTINAGMITLLKNK